MGVVHDLDPEVIAALSVALPRVPGVAVVRDASLSDHTALRVGGPADLLVHAPTPEAVHGVTELAGRVHCPWRVVWPLDGAVPKDGGVAGIAIVPGRAFECLRKSGRGEALVELGAATPFAALAAAGPGFEALSRWPGTPGGLLAAGHGKWLAGACAALKTLTASGVRERRVAATSVPERLARTSTLVSITLRPVPPDHPTPPPAGLVLEPDAPLLAVGATWRDIAHAFEVLDLCDSRLRGWTLSASWPGVVRQNGAGTTTDLELFARGLSDKLLRTRGMATRSSSRVYGRPPIQSRRPTKNRGAPSPRGRR